MDTIIYDIGETLRTCSECHVTDEDRHYIAGPRVLCTRCAGNLERSEIARGVHVDVRKIPDRKRKIMACLDEMAADIAGIKNDVAVCGYLPEACRKILHNDLAAIVAVDREG